MRPRLPTSALPLLVAFFVPTTVGCGGPPPEVAPPPSVPTAPPEPDIPEPEADDTSTLDVISGQPTEILLDGKAIGTTPISGHKVTPGSHEVTFVDPKHGNRTMFVTVAPGDAQTVQSDPAPSIIEQKPEEKN